MIGLLIYIVHYEAVICKTPYEKTIIRPDGMEDQRNQHTSTNIVRLSIALTSILAITCICMRQYYKVLWINRYLQTDNQSHISYQYNQIIRGKHCDSIDDDNEYFDSNFLYEVLILCLFPVPYYDTFIST